MPSVFGNCPKFIFPIPFLTLPRSTPFAPPSPLPYPNPRLTSLLFLLYSFLTCFQGKKGGEAHRYTTRDKKANPGPNLKKRKAQKRNKLNDDRISKQRCGEDGPRLMCKVCCVDLGQWGNKLRLGKDKHNHMERHLAVSPTCRVTPGGDKKEVCSNFRNSNWIEGEWH